MPFNSGLVAQLGFKQESTAGTAVTVDHFLPMVSEGINFSIENTQGTGLYGSTDGIPLESRWTQTTRTVEGDFEVECSDNGMGLLWRAATGSTTTPVNLTGAYGSTFALGDQRSAGSSLTLQVGRPGRDGTVQPFTWNGCKVTEWEVGGSVTEPLNASFSVDGWNETLATALATASYSASQQFGGADLFVKIGGTLATSSGKTTVSSGTSLTNVKSATVKGTNSLYTDAYYANSSGLKGEQTPNDYREYEFELELDYATTQTIYGLAVAGTSTTLQVYWQKPTAYTGSLFPLLEFTAPVVKFDVPNINVGGPEQLSYTVTGKVVKATSGGHNAFQIYTVNTDAAL